MKSKNKELLQKILTKLSPYRSLAKGFLSILDSLKDEKTIDSILSIIINAIKSAKFKQDKIKLEIQVQNVQKVKNQEELDNLKNEIISLVENNK